VSWSTGEDDDYRFVNPTNAVGNPTRFRRVRTAGLSYLLETRVIREASADFGGMRQHTNDPERQAIRPFPYFIESASAGEAS
jgi:hypothetical protein